MSTDSYRSLLGMLIGLIFSFILPKYKYKNSTGTRLIKMNQLHQMYRMPKFCIIITQTSGELSLNISWTCGVWEMQLVCDCTSNYVNVSGSPRLSCCFSIHSSYAHIICLVLVKVHDGIWETAWNLHSTTLTAQSGYCLHGYCLYI